MHTFCIDSLCFCTLKKKLHILGLHVLPVITRVRNVRSKKRLYQSIGHALGIILEPKTEEKISASNGPFSRRRSHYNITNQL